MIVVNWEKVKNYGILSVVGLQFVFAAWLLFKFNKLEKVVIESAKEDRQTTLQQKVTNYNTATANAYTIIAGQDVFKNYTWEIDEIRSATEVYCPDKQHFWSRKHCFMKIKPGIIEAYKTISPFGFQMMTVDETLYIAYWKKTNNK